MWLETAVILIPLLAVLAPLLARALGRWVRIPVVVFELLLGIIVGPAVLGWGAPSDVVEVFSNLGLAMLFFIAGTEIDFTAFRGRLGRRAVGGWLISLVLGVGAGFALFRGEAAIVIGIALCSTALGTIVPILRDAGELRTPFGRAVSVIGAVGEFAPLIAISVFLGSREPGLTTIVLALFAAIAAVGIWLAFRIPRGAMHRFVNSTLHTSGQFAIRVVLLIIGALVAPSLVLDLDMLLGAFTAGVIWRLLMRDASDHERRAVESKVEGVAFGFLIPLFFVYTGITFDLGSLIARPVLFLYVPVVMVALLVVRGLPSMLAAPEGSHPRERAAIGLLGATGLPIIVAVTAIGVDEQIITPAAAAVLVAGGMLSVLLFPLVAMTLRGRTVEEPQSLQDDRV